MWLRLEDTLDDHPKFRGLDPRAGWLHIRALCFCGRHLTDGLVPGHVARDLAAQVDPQQSMFDGEHALLTQLVQRGVWHRKGDDYLIHDYLEYNPSRRKVIRERKAAKRRRQKGHRERVSAGTHVGRASGERRASVGRASANRREVVGKPSPVNGTIRYGTYETILQSPPTPPYDRRTDKRTPVAGPLAGEVQALAARMEMP